MGFNINITGDVKKIFKERTRTLMDKIENELDAFGQGTVNDAKRLAPVDEGHLRQNITYQKKAGKSKIEVEIIAATDYAAYIEYGTGQFAPKYVATLPKEWQDFAKKYKGPGGGTYDEFIMRIFKWIKRKGLTLNPKQYQQGDSYTTSGKLRKPRKKKKVDKEKGQQQLAYLITRKILKDGIKQRPFLYPAVESNRIELLKRLKALR